jgi:hypothetical protein
MNSETKRQVHVQPKAMMVEIDLDHPKRQLQMKDSKAGFPLIFCPTIAGPRGSDANSRTRLPRRQARREAPKLHRRAR